MISFVHVFSLRKLKKGFVIIAIYVYDINLTETPEELLDVRDCLK